MFDQQQPSSSQPQQQPDLKQEEAEQLPRNDFAPVRWVDPSNKNAGETTSAATKEEIPSSASLRAQEEENLRYLKWKAEQDAKERQIVSDDGGAQKNNNEEEMLTTFLNTRLITVSAIGRSGKEYLLKFAVYPKKFMKEMEWLYTCMERDKN